MNYPKKKIIKQILQFDYDKGIDVPTNIGSIYEVDIGRQSGVIDLNRAKETPKGDERYLSFVIVDPLTASRIKNKVYGKGDMRNFTDGSKQESPKQH